MEGEIYRDLSEIPKRSRCTCLCDYLGRKVTRVVELTRHLTCWQKGLFMMLIMGLIGGNIYNVVNNIRKYQYSQEHPVATSVWSDIQPSFPLVIQVPIMNITFKCATFLCSDIDCSGFNKQVFEPCGITRLTTQDVVINIPELKPNWVYSIVASGPEWAKEFGLIGIASINEFRTRKISIYSYGIYIQTKTT